MNYFLRLNIISAIYALMFLIPVELILNGYTLIMDYNFGPTSFFIALLIEVCIGTLIVLKLQTMWFRFRKSNFWTMILWLPYFILFLPISGFLFPTLIPEVDPSPGTGFVLLAGFVAFPIYILFVNLIFYWQAMQQPS
ncbi:MAG: hypothetical protein ACRC5C_12775 [Bacilli bacterium]